MNAFEAAGYARGLEGLRPQTVPTFVNISVTVQWQVQSSIKKRQL